jgi:hypothetical protein
METQVRLVPALCALHNFIRIHDPADDMGITQEEIDGMLEEERAGEGELQDGIAAEESDRASLRRDAIAQDMWNQYREYNDRRNMRRRQTRRNL